MKFIPLLSPLITLSTVVTASARSIGPDASLIVTNGVVSPDGFSRRAILINGQFPGPNIMGFKEETFRLGVTNRLTDPVMRLSTSVHWHGFFQRGSAWADGPAFVTQCPIIPGESFQYHFAAPDAPGTYWYHSHLREQYCDGLRGAMAVYNRADPFARMYDVDNESTIITLADWYHLPAELLQGATSDSTLINGVGRYRGGPAVPLSVITVEYGKRYRFRLVNIACSPNYQFTIDNHDMTVIEVDGVPHNPVRVDSIQIFAAQRYSFVLEATRPINNYWIRAQPDSSQTKLVGFAGGINSAILRYAGAPPREPLTQQSPSLNPLNERNLHPLEDPAAPGRPFPGGADLTLTLDLGLNVSSRMFTINGTSFQPPSVPVLLQILSGAKLPQELLPPGSVYTLPRNAVIELIIPPGNAPGGPHPFHLHGHTFSVVRSAGSSTYNYVNPVRRDTVNIGTGANDRVAIRFVTDNPGPWHLHCHIDFHLQAGLAVVLAEDVDNIPSVVIPPKEWHLLCPKYEASGIDDL